MNKHALVVGSQTFGLEGPIWDANRMAEMLGKDGFKIDLRTDREQASRKGILEGYKQLIENAKDGVAVVYFSGHGVRALPYRGAADGGPTSYQAIVPTDFESDEDRFLGITDVELSTLLAMLTKHSTKNATVILDCCHSAAMSRDVESRPKSLIQPRYIDVQRHIARVLEEDKLAVGLLAGTGNPDAVRIVAAGESQSAFERHVGDKMVGTFTESLLIAFEQAEGQRVTWESIGRFVRERVLGIHSSQRPDVEGKARRYLFDTDEAPPSGAISVVSNKAGTTLRAGRLHGVRTDDEYAILPNHAPIDDLTRRIATATVAEVSGTSSTATVALAAGTTELPETAQGVQTRSAAPQRSVRVVAEHQGDTRIKAAIEATGRFLVTEDPDVLAIVTQRNGNLEMTYSSGLDVVRPIPDTAEGLARVVENLAALTAARSLRELRSANLPDTAINVTWGRVADGKVVDDLAVTGEVLSVGTWFAIQVRNTHPLKRKLYVSMFDIGLEQRIQCLTGDYPAGFELDHGETFTLGQDANGKIEGMQLVWADDMAMDTLRHETVVVIASDRPSELRSLERAGARGAVRGVGKAALNELEQLVEQFQLGKPVTRNLDKAKVADGYIVKHLDFELSPWPLPARSESKFEIDHTPPMSTRLFIPRGADREPDKLAIQITGITIHDVKTWFGGPGDIRIDTLVVTRLPEGSTPYRAGTWRFKDIKDGDVLPLHDALAYHGDVRDFVELRVWASRDHADSTDLIELIKQQANTAEFRAATGALLTATGAVAVAAPLVAAVAATATLTAIAWRVLSKAHPNHIGLYQTSMLASQGGFGKGRHPTSGLYRAQDFSFAFEVKAG